MTRTPRKGLHDIATRSSRTSSLDTPQHAFLSMASLELKKTLCNKVLEAARKRCAEMDTQIAELEREQERLLAMALKDDPGLRRSPRGPHWEDGDGAVPSKGFTLQY